MEILGEIQKPASIESISSLMGFVESQIGMMQFSEERRKNICLAVEEALNNILYHGKIDNQTDINIAFKLDNLGRFLIVITDLGAPFNMLLNDVLPDELKDSKENRPAISTKIMKKVIKDIEYKRLENKNILTFTIPKL